MHRTLSGAPNQGTLGVCDFIHDGEAVNRPNNAMEIYLQELGNESSILTPLSNKAFAFAAKYFLSPSASAVEITIDSLADHWAANETINLFMRRSRAFPAPNR